MCLKFKRMFKIDYQTAISQQLVEPKAQNRAHGHSIVAQTQYRNLARKSGTHPNSLSPKQGLIRSHCFFVPRSSSTMSNSSDQLEEIKALISSGSKCLAYSTLLHFQEQSSGDPTSIQALAGISQTLLSLIVADISDDDEEM